MPAVDFRLKIDKEVERIETSEKLTEKDRIELYEEWNRRLKTVSIN